MVIVILGVSGSGKTTVGRVLATKVQWRFEDADEWHSPENIAKMRNGEPLTDADRAPWLRKLNGAIREWLAERRNVVLACSALKVSYRDALREGTGDADALRFIYLKLDYATLDSRIRARRGHFMPESLLRGQFRTLEEPSGSEALTVDASHPVEAIVNEMVSGMCLRLEASESRIDKSWHSGKL